MQITRWGWESVMAGTDVRAGCSSLRYGPEVISFSVRVQRDRKLSKVAVHVEPDGRVLVDAHGGVGHAAVIVAVVSCSGGVA